jgi:hypothetical protein
MRRSSPVVILFATVIGVALAALPEPDELVLPQVGGVSSSLLPGRTPLPLTRGIDGILPESTSLDGHSTVVHSYSSPLFPVGVLFHMSISSGTAALAVSRCVVLKDSTTSSTVGATPSCVTAPTLQEADVVSVAASTFATAALP